MIREYDGMKFVTEDEFLKNIPIDRLYPSQNMFEVNRLVEYPTAHGLEELDYDSSYRRDLYVLSSIGEVSNVKLLPANELETILESNKKADFKLFLARTPKKISSNDDREELHDLLNDYMCDFGDDPKVIVYRDKLVMTNEEYFKLFIGEYKDDKDNYKLKLGARLVCVQPLKVKILSVAGQSLIAKLEIEIEKMKRYTK